MRGAAVVRVCEGSAHPQQARVRVRALLLLRARVRVRARTDVGLGSASCISPSHLLMHEAHA